MDAMFIPSMPMTYDISAYREDKDPDCYAPATFTLVSCSRSCASSPRVLGEPRVEAISVRWYWEEERKESCSESVSSSLGLDSRRHLTLGKSPDLRLL